MFKPGDKAMCVLRNTAGLLHARQIYEIREVKHCPGCGRELVDIGHVSAYRGMGYQAGGCRKCNVISEGLLGFYDARLFLIREELSEATVEDLLEESKRKNNGQA